MEADDGRKNPGSAESEKDIFIREKSFTAVEDVSFFLNSGEVLGIVGESGSGKSTVAKMITHLTDITDGKIFSWEKISHMRREKLSGKLTGNFRWSSRHRQDPLTPDVPLGTESGKVSGIWG